jgi:hypothetical protein
LEYLQGFADRAYERLVKSGDYSYRALARLLEATIEYHYPLRIVSNGAAFPAQTARSSAPELRAANGRGERRWAAFAQRPTDLPSSRALIKTVNELALRFPVAYGAWRLLPRSFRTIVRRSLGLPW